MITIGVDFHKRTSSYNVLNTKGQSIKACKLENTRDNIREFVQSFEGPKRLAMEATRSWGLYHDSVTDLVDEFHLGHPKKMKAISECQTKNDKMDASTIAKLAFTGFFPEAYVSAVDIRQLRSLLRFRHFLVNERRSIRNQTHALIDRNLWPSDKPQAFKNIFCKRGLVWLRDLKLPPRDRFILDECLESFKTKSQKILELEAFIQSQTLDLPGLKHLRTVPGFKLGRVNALIVLTETADIQRFSKARSFAHYSGLIPREYSSGDKHRTGRLIKDANLHLREAFIESTFPAIRMDKGLKAYYQSVKQRKGSGPAIIATARKLSYAVYHVLKEQRAYRPEPLPPAADCHP